MSVIYDLYEKDLVYDGLYETNEENEIINFIKNNLNKDCEYEFLNNKNVHFQNELSYRSLNSINWYPISKNSNVLEVLGRYGTITNNLLKKEVKLTCIETIKNRAEINDLRNCSENLKIICTSNILECDLQEKYDYIILSNVIENSKSILNNPNLSTKNAVKLLLKKFKLLLNDNGKILIYTDNKFGVRQFAGFKKYEVENTFDNIVDKNNLKINKYFSKNELLDIFKELDIDNYKFYYPLPDSKNTSVIYSDDYLPNSNSSKLKYNICYNKFNTIVFNETEAMLQITKSGYFDIFANSYIIEIANNSCEIDFVGFNNFRKKDYQLVTSINNNKVIKRNCYLEGKNHLNNIKRNIDILNSLNIKTLDSYKDNFVFSKYTNAKSLDNILYEKIINEGKEYYLDEIVKWYEFINDKLQRVQVDDTIIKNNIFNKYNIDVAEEILSKLNFVKDGFLDMIFENIFVIEEEYNIYDQEWYEENIPSEYILYRAIQSLYFHNKKIEFKCSKNELFEYFKISEFVDLFEKLENSWQNSIVDKDTLEIFENTYSTLTTLEELKRRSEDAEFYTTIINSQNQTIEELKDQNEKLSQKIKQIKSSSYWKIYQKILGRKNGHEK